MSIEPSASLLAIADCSCVTLGPLPQASHLQGRTPEEALRNIESLGAWPLPMERLLNRPLRLEFKE
jgi:hypothetical protein